MFCVGGVTGSVLEAYILGLREISLPEILLEAAEPGLVKKPTGELTGRKQ